MRVISAGICVCVCVHIYYTLAENMALNLSVIVSHWKSAVFPNNLFSVFVGECVIEIHESTEKK